MDCVVAFCTANRNPAVTDRSGETAWLVFDVDTLGEEEVKNTLKLTNLRQIFETAKSVAFVAREQSRAEQVFALYAEQFEMIEAAGGVVVSRAHEVLLIYRNGKWDLPKGKVEPDEEIADAALREVEEECGISGLKLGEIAARSFHTYPLDGRWVLKRTTWYMMKHDGKGELVPQTEEGITDTRWVPIGDDSLKPYLKETYQTIRDVLSEVF